VNRFAKRLAAGSVALSVGLITGAMPALASAPANPAGAEISLQPENPSAASPNYFTLAVAPGATVHDAVIVINRSKAPVSLAVSPVDGLTGQTTGSVYGNRQDTVRKAGKWVTPELRALTLPAQSSRTIAFTVTVPATAVPGDHLAGIAVENTVPTESSNGFNIKQILRNVIGVRVIVPGRAAFSPKLTSLGIEQIGATGIASVSVGLGNSGRALAKPSLDVALRGPSGYSSTITRKLDTVLPGDTVTYPFAWPDILVKGSYDVTATLTGGGTSVTMNRTVVLGTTLAGVTHPLPKTIVKTQKSGMPMWMLLVVGLAVLSILGFGANTVVRRRHRGPPKQQQA
jgi:Bacterial protein of unknown function (DUF916)